MAPTVYLFDVDGTLITTSGVGRRAIERTFENLFGSGEPLRSIPFGGMTDRAIVRAGLCGIDHDDSESEIDRVLERYLAVLEAEVAAAPIETYRAHPGIVAALDALATREGTAVGLGTGNIRDGARIKLSKVDLYRRFSFGGFGSDAEDRTELIRVGAERGAAELGVPRDACRVVVIGDTPKDIAAAQGIGAESCAVATGTFSLAELSVHGATHTCVSLAEDGVLDWLLAGA